VPVKSRVEISQNFVPFSEYINFILNHNNNKKILDVIRYLIKLQKLFIIITFTNHTRNVISPTYMNFA
jgi:hypothetical protein